MIRAAGTCEDAQAEEHRKHALHLWLIRRQQSAEDANMASKERDNQNKYHNKTHQVEARNNGDALCKREAS